MAKRRKQRTKAVAPSSEPFALTQPDTIVTRAMVKDALRRVAVAVGVLPSVMYVSQEGDDDPYFKADTDRNGFDDGKTVGVYDLRELRTQSITKSLLPYQAKPPAVQLPAGTTIGPKRRRRRRRARVAR